MKSKLGLKLVLIVAFAEPVEVTLLIPFLLNQSTGRAQSTPSPDSVSVVKTLNRTLVSLMNRAPDSRQVIEILTARKAAVEKAIQEDPASVRGLSLDDAVINAIPAPASQLLETTGEWFGIVEILVQDDFADSRSQTRWRIQTGTESAEMFFPKDYAGRRVRPGAQVRIRGIRSGNYIAVETLVSMAQAAPSRCSTTGVQNIAILMITTPSNPAFPAGWNAASVAQIFFSPAGVSLNGYWQDASYGKTSAAGQVFGPFALPNDYSCGNYSDLATAAVQAADSVDFSQFGRIGIVFPVQSCTFGGLGTLGCTSTVSQTPAASLNVMSSDQESTPQLVSTAWFPVFPFQVPNLYVGILAHEEGHNLGLNHANSDDFGSVPLGSLDNTGINTEYGDPFSVMGNANQNGSSWQGQPIMGQYSAEHKSLILNWLQGSDYQQVQNSGTFTLAPFESSSGTRALRVLRNASINSWLWLEYRQPLGLVDSTLTLIPNFQTTDIFQGAFVHYENPELDSFHTYLIDFNAIAAPNNFYNSTLHPGQSWSDPYSLLTLKANSPVAGGLPITITYDQPCASLQPSASVYQPSGGTGSISVSAPSTCAWTAATSATWLTLAGQVSGQGNGVVNFSVAANVANSVRTGDISLQRQDVPILQAGTGVSVINALPPSGTGGIGVAGPFTFTLNDTNGFADIWAVNIQFFGASGSCLISYQPQDGSIWLANDAETEFEGPFYSGTLSNSRCSFNASGTSSGGSSGNELQITVQVGFTAAFAGVHQIYVQGFGTIAGDSILSSVGTWDVSSVLSINTNGIVPIFGSSGAIQPGSWVSIFGSNLASAPATWNNDFPTTLGGTSVTINNKPAYLSYAAPGLINLEAPDDTARGTVNVVVTNANGSATGTVTLADQGPSFSLLGDAKHVAAIILRPDGSGAFGNGANSYDVVGPAGTSLGYKTVPAKAGDSVVIFGVGFGSTNPAVPAGQPFTGAAAATDHVTITIAGQSVNPSFAGVSGPGLFQFNLTIPPGLGTGDQTILATVNGASTQPNVVFAMQ